MIRCSRQAFILLASGTLMDRGADAKVRIGDTQEAHAALAAHDRGEPVHLTPQDTVIQNGRERWPTLEDLKDMAPVLPASLTDRPGRQVPLPGTKAARRQARQAGYG